MRKRHKNILTRKNEVLFSPASVHHDNWNRLHPRGALYTEHISSSVLWPLFIEFWVSINATRIAKTDTWPWEQYLCHVDFGAGCIMPNLSWTTGNGCGEILDVHLPPQWARGNITGKSSEIITVSFVYLLIVWLLLSSKLTHLVRR